MDWGSSQQAERQVQGGWAALGIYRQARRRCPCGAHTGPAHIPRHLRPPSPTSASIPIGVTSRRAGRSWRKNCRAPSGSGRPICPCSNPALLPLAFCAHRAHQQDSRSRLKDELQSTRRERRAALQAELQRTQAACSAELAQLQAAGAAEVAARRAEVEAELTARGVAVEAELLRAAQAMEQTERGLVQRAGELEAAQVSVEREVWSGCGQSGGSCRELRSSRPPGRVWTGYGMGVERVWGCSGLYVVK